MAPMQLHWDIFCRVIDNYGDIGICWRLARQLVAEHGRQVRLWVDDLASLSPLCTAVDASRAEQWVQGVEIRHWSTHFPEMPVADVVIEAFACDLPESYIGTMAKAERKPCWVNLEYLTAEQWAEDCHGMASPHPSLPLTKYFFFPGFSTQSGGLLRETDLLQKREAQPSKKLAHEPLEISLFCYDTAPVGDLLEALERMQKPSVVHVPPGKPLAAVMRHLPGNGPWQLGNSRIEPLPFMALDDYDQLLWQCDINFVRGEDSFVRAQWAGQPFIWQIYRQEEDAHLIKLSAFLERYCATMLEQDARAITNMFVAWNGAESSVADAWAAFLAHWEGIGRYSRAWSRKMAMESDLATRLVNFCAARV